MGDSVAGKIRIDLLANAAGATAGFAQAGDAAEKMEKRFNRSFDSVKQAEARALQEHDNWVRAMRGGAGPLANIDGMLGGNKGSSAAWKEQIGDDLKSPWGKTAQTRLSRDAAEMAAKIGEGGTKVADSLRVAMGQLSGVGGPLGQAGGLLGRGLSMIGGGPGALALAGVGAVSAYASHRYDEGMDVIAERRQHAVEIGRQSRELGQSVEDTGRLNDVGIDAGAASKLQRSMIDNPDAFKSMGLDATKLASEPLKQAMIEVSDALGKTVSPAERAKEAVDLFGKAGVELLPALDHLKDKMAHVFELDPATIEKTAAAEKRAKEDAAIKQVGDAGSANFASGAKGIGSMLTFGMFDRDTGVFGAKRTSLRRAEGMGQGGKLAEYYRQLEEDERLAPEREQQRIQAEAEAAKRDRQRTALKSVAEQTQSVHDEALGPKAAAAARMRRDLQKAGVGDMEIEEALWARSQAEKAATAYRERHEAQEKVKALVRQDPMKAYQEEEKKLDRDLAGGRLDKNQEGLVHKQNYKNLLSGLGIHDVVLDFAEEYAHFVAARGELSANVARRTATQLADKSLTALDEAFDDAVERYQKHNTQLDASAARGDLDPEQLRRRREAETRGELSALGVKRPEDDFEQQMRLIKKAFDSGDITGGEARLRERQLRRQAVSERAGEVETVSPIAAMAAGSREAYSMQVQAQLNDPKLQAAIATNAKLDAIEKRLAEQAAKAKQPIVAAAAPDF
jgi:hypothetical protein